MKEIVPGHQEARTQSSVSTEIKSSHFCLNLPKKIVRYNERTAFQRREGLMGETQSILDQLSLIPEKFEASAIKSQWGMNFSWKSAPNLGK